MDECKVLSAKLAALETRVEALTHLLEVRLNALTEARELQFNENMRRFAELNGEADRLRQMQLSYVARDSYELTIRQIERDVKALQAFQSNLTGRIAVWGFLIGAVIALVSAVVVSFVRG